MVIIIAGIIGLISAVYFLAPGRTNIAFLGLDYAEPPSSAARTDTIILSTIVPSGPYVGMLSIPRDLWVNIPNVGENRINAAHFFAEATQPGTGPAATIETIKNNFGVDVKYFMRIKFEGFRDIFNVLGGIDIDLTTPMAGYEAGTHHLTARKALAFARNRTGSDDFARMQQGQLILKATLKQVLQPKNWLKIPPITTALIRSIDTNIPAALWPRLGLALIRVGPAGIDNRLITREMVTPFTSDQGASVLAPNWNLINPVLLEVFGQ
jgi:LCP family protein required for cell wall assembly